MNARRFIQGRTFSLHSCCPRTMARAAVWDGGISNVTQRRQEGSLSGSRSTGDCIAAFGEMRGHHFEIGVISGLNANGWLWPEAL